MTYVINALLPISFTVEAGSEKEAIERATSYKKYSVVTPDGEQLAVTEEDIRSVELAQEA